MTCSENFRTFPQRTPGSKPSAPLKEGGIIGIVIGGGVVVIISGLGMYFRKSFSEILNPSVTDQNTANNQEGTQAPQGSDIENLVMKDAESQRASPENPEIQANKVDDPTYLAAGGSTPRHENTYPDQTKYDGTSPLVGITKELVEKQANEAVLAVYKITYDNPILNHPHISEIFREATQVGGVRAIDDIIAYGKDQTFYTKFKEEIEINGVKNAVSKFISIKKDEYPEQNFADSTKYIHSADLVNSLINARNFVEYVPLLQSLARGIYSALENYLPESIQNTTMPEILNNKPLLFTTHLILGHAGSVALPENLVNQGILISSAGSAVFGIRLLASEYLTQMRTEIAGKDLNAYDLAKYCTSTMIAYTAPAITSCTLAQVVLPGYVCTTSDMYLKASLAGQECFAVYQSTKAYQVPTTADKALPYIADTVATIMSYANSASVLSMVACVVTTDLITRVILDQVPVGIKEEYVDSALDYANEVYSCVVESFSGFIGNYSEYGF